MRRILLLSVIPLLVAGTAFSQAGTIMIASDAGGTDCNFVAAGFVQIYSFHVNTLGATGSQWKLDHPATWTHFGDIWNFPTIIGNSNIGVSIGYGACLAGPIALGVSNYGAAGDPLCTLISIVPDPASLSGEIEGVDCAANKTFPTGGAGIVNPDANCPCFRSPVESTTWGNVKALYQ